MSELPFDRISVVLGGAESDYSVGEFLALPLSDRVKSLLFGKINFLLAGVASVLKNRSASSSEDTKNT